VQLQVKLYFSQTAKDVNAGTIVPSNYANSSVSTTRCIPMTYSVAQLVMQFVDDG